MLLLISIRRWKQWSPLQRSSGFTSSRVMFDLVVVVRSLLKMYSYEVFPIPHCVNEHELMMLEFAVTDPDLIFYNLTASMLVIGLIASSLLVNTTNDPTLIIYPNHPAGVDTIIVVG